MRAQLGRELAKTRATKSGQGLSDSYKSTWIFWESLQFLTTVLNAGKSKDNLCLGNEDEDATEEEIAKETERDVACVWPALPQHVATSSNNVGICCVEMLRSFGRGFTTLN